MDNAVNEDKLKVHKNWLALAEKKHDERIVKQTKTYADYLDNNVPASTDDKYQSSYNHYFINIRKQVPELLGDLQIKIKPSQGRDVIDLGDMQSFDNKKACIAADNKVNELFKKMAVRYDLKSCVYDLLLANHTGMLVGNDTQINEAPVVPDEMSALMGEKLANGEAIPGEMPIAQPQIESIPKNEVVIKRVSYQDCMVDPDSVEYFYNDKGYAIRRVKLTKEKAMAISPEFDEKGYEADDKENLDNESARRWTMVEIYDYTGDKVTRTRYMGKCTKEIDEVEFDYDPMPMCKLNFLPDTAYVKSDMPYYRSAVEESNFYRTVVMNNLDKSSIPKVFADKDALTPENKDKIASDVAFEVIDVDTHGRGLTGSYAVESFKTSDNDMQAAIDRSTTDIREIAGVNNERFKAGNTPATNATISNNAFLSAIDERKQILRDFIANVVKSVVSVIKEISINQETFTYEQPNGVREEITWNNKDLEFIDFEVEVSIESSVPDAMKLGAIRDFANWLTQPNIYMGLNAEGKKLNFTEMVVKVGSYLMPDSNIEKLIVDSNQLTPEKEDLLMMQGQPVEPQEGEDFNKHLEDHKALLVSHPVMQTLPPEVLQIFDAHIVKTIQMAEKKQSMMTQGQPMGDAKSALPMAEPTNEPTNPTLGNLSGGQM